MHEASLQVPIHPGVSQYSTRQNPLDKITDRPDSSESGISVSSATTKEKSEKTNEKSALGSVLRTARLTNGLESPRTPRHVSVHGIE
ncbi:hypothetical protein DPMN_176420 [Dreissena polymorpha]|uniref:Uncharacterized protein n=1 Tax=Dreissena polymorpha TaxID=45954 RepID=A0A9D4EAL7_DREPO|nr:hypothetical protein DPMN_176248 [Dreissena polymorpha]KAH3775024.1 hypothetical protein DPMN_176420 [Dreissena polymorpha]